MSDIIILFDDDAKVHGAYTDRKKADADNDKYLESRGFTVTVESDRCSRKPINSPDFSKDTAY